MKFKLCSKFKPIPPQIEATQKIVENIERGVKDIVLLGVTGCGKTFVAANVIEKVQRPILVISHNKTLAAQLYQEFKEFFPENAVHYFVSYYDYYQPEAYIPQSDTYIEKDAKINEVIDRLRHEAVQSLIMRNDVIVVASVSCIYNIGSPENYQKISLILKKNQAIKRRDLLLNLVRLQYQRNDIDFQPGTFRVRGNLIEIFSPTGKEIIRIEILGNNISRILTNTKNSRILENNFIEISETHIFPAKFWVTPKDKLEIALQNIQSELQERLRELKKEGKLLEAERLEKRTNYDIEMIRETGWCHGIENYSRHLEFRQPGDAPFTLLDYYPKDFITFIDESHMTIPQLHSMYEGDKQRKQTLIEYGFRLPSALDNRPLKFEEFEKKVGQKVYTSATPGQYELEKAKKEKSIVELLIRPTGLLDPKIEIKPTKNQIKDAIKECKKAIKSGERVLITTLTKRMAEDLADYLEEQGFKVHYLHSEIKTLDRPGILRDLRLGKYDIVVGINLLREGLDLPEVALILILDADKEGFLRNETTLIQTMGRAARHPNGRVIMYADEVTGSMKRAIKEVERRRKIQADYNKKHHITPQPIKKEIRDWDFAKDEEEIKNLGELANIKDIKFLQKEMEKAAKELNFEKAAKIRDEIKKIKKK
ncbi:MAG TPA: excinuclease ABC subunit UvrB [Candidatus Pacearchaeota archaeon]|nr:excinuclease ABC subunit UvrB [Candidatus Pacearchaeota archaeon]HOK94235.1 excinuclease ABC subunit UvrB [Candidatus Pacearchaeota archaeon]HPO75349.1 excinuclease ABC subunit UvrB [Candidatus Pacearchaeota archaeon]